MPLFLVHVQWLHSVSYWRFLPQHNSEYKILIRYNIVWLLVVFSVEGQREAMLELAIRRGEDARGRIKRLLYLSTLSLMPSSLSRPQLLTELTNG